MITSFDEYLIATSETAIYPDGEEGVTYLIMGIVGESGEVCNKLKKALRGDYKLTAQKKKEIGKELGDICWYLFQLLKRYRRKPSDFIPDSIEIYESRHKNLDIKYINRNSVLLAHMCSSFGERYFVSVVRAGTVKEFFCMVLNTLSVMANQLDINLIDVLNNNINKLSVRKKEGVLQGDGDNRTLELIDIDYLPYDGMQAFIVKRKLGCSFHPHIKASFDRDNGVKFTIDDKILRVI